MARTDPHAVRDEVRQAHPDWIAVNREGQPVRHWANPELWVTCALGPYNFDFMDQVHREIVTQIPDRRHLRQPLGAAGRRLLLRPLPAELQGRDRARAAAHERPARARRGRQYLEWRTARLIELWKRWDATVQAANAEARFIPNGPPSMKSAGRARGDSVHRQPGAPRADAALEQRPARQGDTAR